MEDPDLFALRTPVLVVLYLIRDQREREVTHPPEERGRGTAPHFCPSEPSPEEAGALLGEDKRILVEPVEQTGRSLILVLQSQ